MAGQKLDFKEHLPIIVKAVEEKTLQCYKHNETALCLYTGPCAIGCVLPKDIQVLLDKSFDIYINKDTRLDEFEMLKKHGFRYVVDSSFSGSSVESFLNVGMLIVDEDQRYDWIRLQQRHDYVVRAKVNSSVHAVDRTIERFESFVKELQVKYPQ